MQAYILLYNKRTLLAYVFSIETYENIAVYLAVTFFLYTNVYTVYIFIRHMAKMRHKQRICWTEFFPGKSLLLAYDQSKNLLKVIAHNLSSELGIPFHVCRLISWLIIQTGNLRQLAFGQYMLVEDQTLLVFQCCVCQHIKSSNFKTLQTMGLEFGVLEELGSHDALWLSCSLQCLPDAAVPHTIECFMGGEIPVSYNRSKQQPPTSSSSSALLWT